MPIPWAYSHATKDWRAFLSDAKEQMNLDSDNSAYTAVQGVLLTFRRRLTTEQGLDIGMPSAPFTDRPALIAEVKALRPDHNLTPDHVLEAVAWALRRHVDQGDLDRILADMPSGAAEFWNVDVADPRELERRIT